MIAGFAPDWVRIFRFAENAVNVSVVNFIDLHCVSDAFSSGVTGTKALTGQALLQSRLVTEPRLG